MFQRCFCGFLVFSGVSIPSRSFGSAVASFTTHWWGDCHGDELGFLDVVRNPEMIPGSENHFFIQFLSFVWLYITAWWWLEHGFYDFPYTRNNHPNWRTHIFQRGWNHQPDYIDIDLYFLSYSYTCNKWTLAKNQVRLSSWVFRLDVPVSARFPSSKKWWIVLCRCTKSPGELRRRLFLVHPTHIGIMVLTRKYPLVN